MQINLEPNEAGGQESQRLDPGRCLPVYADGDTLLPLKGRSFLRLQCDRAASHFRRVLVDYGSPEGQKSGLLADSVVMTDNLATICGNRN